MKRATDVLISLLGLILTGPILALSALLVWLQDFRNPLYVSLRVRNQQATFRMYKFRSMVPNADQIGGTSTAADDRRLTAVGRAMRVFKIDELPQLWNVLIGDMSLVGPRPQVVQDAIKYTTEENHLFDVRPGITDFSSIVFADEADILDGAPDPDARYDQLIRPWKSRLGLFYARHHSLLVDLLIIVLTVLTILSRRSALGLIQRLLHSMGADSDVVTVAGRTHPVVAALPPGADFPAENGPYIPESVFERAWWLQTLNRVRRVPVVAVQVGLVAFSNYCAWLLRYDGALSPDRMAVLWPTISWLIGIRALVFLPFNLYQGLWLYTGIYDLQALVGGIIASSAVFWLWVRLFLPPATYPQSVMVIDALLLIVLMGGIRMSRRLLAELAPSAGQGRRVLVYGAGRGGEMMVRDMRHQRPIQQTAVGLIDDNVRKLGLRIHGVPVVGSRRDLPRVIAQLRPDELLIAAAGMTREDIERIRDLVKPFGLPVTTSAHPGGGAASVTAGDDTPRLHSARGMDRGIPVMAQFCPKCRAQGPQRSKARNVFERLRRQFSERRIFRCVKCGWRGWLVPVTVSGPAAAPGNQVTPALDLTSLDDDIRNAGDR